MSKLQDQARRQHATACYPASFEQYQRRPVYIVQVFTYQATAAIFTEWIPVRYRVGCKKQRKAVADWLRWARRQGLNRHTVQRLAVEMIDAPESYAGIERKKTADRVREEISGLDWKQA